MYSFNGEKKLLKLNLDFFVALFLAIAPVFDPYILAEIGSSITIHVNDLIVVLLALLCFCRSISFSKKTGFLIYWCLGMFVLSVFGWLSAMDIQIMLSIKNLFIWLIYAILIMYLWKRPCRNTFFKIVEGVALLTTIVIFLQFILGNAGIATWNGRIPFLNLSKYDGWSGYIDKNTFEIRPCGIFQEASYSGIYLLVAYADAIKEGRLKKAILFALGMFITTSMVAVLGVVIVTIYIFVFSEQLKVDKKIKKRFSIILLIGLVFFSIYGLKNTMLVSVFDYVQRRLSNFKKDLVGTRVSSTQIRLIGNIMLFSQYNLWQKLFGFGAQQYAQHFNIVNYSNNIVNIILNFGVVGLTFFFISFYKLYTRIKKENVVYFIILMIVFCVDQQWFNWFFFYLLTACILEK